MVEDQLPDGEVEIGYFLKRIAWGNGYATEAAQRILQFAFEEVVAVTDPENRRSRRVLEKIDFLSTGIRRAYGEDLPGFQIIRESWLGRQQLPQPPHQILCRQMRIAHQMFNLPVLHHPVSLQDPGLREECT